MVGTWELHFIETLSEKKLIKAFAEFTYVPRLEELVYLEGETRKVSEICWDYDKQIIEVYV